MKNKIFTPGRKTLFIILALALILSACNMPASGSDIPTPLGGITNTPSPTPTTTMPDPTKGPNILTQSASYISTLVGPKAVETATPAPSEIVAVPTNTPLATVEAPASPVPTNTLVPTQAINSYAWVDNAWDVVYSNKTAMSGGMKFEGPAVCEWWDQKGFAFKATFDPAKNTINVTELHEAMFFLMEGENYTYPTGYIGTCYKIDQGDTSVAKLKDSYRHLLFFSNIYGNDSDQIMTLKREGKIWEEMIVEAKDVHIYMHIWLEANGFGVCNFRDQTGCYVLSLIVVQPPLGTSIKK